MYRIKDWHQIFENNRSRELKRMDWVPIPNRMDGSGYVELIEHPNGAAHFGAWLALVEISSRQKERGTLPHPHAGLPQDDAALARMLSKISRIPASVFEELFPRLLSPYIGWIEPITDVVSSPCIDTAEIPQGTAEIPQQGAPLRERAGARLITRKGREEKEEKEEKEPARTAPSWSLDETYTEFAGLTRKLWPQILDEEIAQGHNWFWLKFSFDEKLLATKNIRARVSANQEGRFVKRMPDYLRVEWRRGPDPSAKNGNGNGNGNGHVPAEDYRPPPGIVNAEVFKKMQKEREEKLAQ